DVARRNRVVGCTPTGIADRGCMTSFVTRFGRRALRRPLRPEESTALVEAAMREAAELVPTSDGLRQDFYRGVELVGRVLLQDPEFLYRIEFGLPEGTPGIVKLTPHEIASRLSFLLWGKPPQDGSGLKLSALADSGQLSEQQQVVDAARSMLAASFYNAQAMR